MARVDGLKGGLTEIKSDYADDPVVLPAARVELPRRAFTTIGGFSQVSIGMAASDGLCLLAALLMTRLLGVPATGSARNFLIVIVLALISWFAVFHAFALYRIWHLSAPEEFRRIISATSVGTLLIMVGTSWWQQSMSRGWLSSIWLFALFFELIARRIWRWRIAALQKNGRLALRTLVIGSNEEAGRLARALELPFGGFIPIGYTATTLHAVSPNGIPVLGSLESLESTIREHAVDCVFVASSALSSDEMMQASRACRRADVEMRISVNLPDILPSRLTIQAMNEIMAVSVNPLRLTRMQVTIKRSFDIAVASVGLLLCMPVSLAVAVAIRLTSPGPILFKQQRVTKDGRVFTMYKFRTMVQDADRVLKDAVIDLTAPFFKMRDDPRVTRVGGVIRAFSLDELPQLWNVIRGDMSLVGPRPLRTEQVESGPELLSPRQEVKAGLTGWWQIHGRNDVDMMQAVRLDLFYIENWSLCLDLYILLKSIGVILSRRGAY